MPGQRVHHPGEGFVLGMSRGPDAPGDRDGDPLALLVLLDLDLELHDRQLTIRTRHQGARRCASRVLRPTCRP